MKKIFLYILFLSSFICFSQLSSFPSAEGFGKYASVGNNATVFFVTNTNDSGPGSLRAACEASGARYVVFRVGGLITLNTPINISNDKIYIAGQTAPGGGIALSAEGTPNIPLIIVEAEDVIIRYIRFRRSSTDVSETNSDCLAIKQPSNRVMIDHISTSFASDEVLSIYDYSGGSSVAGVQNVTIQYSIIGRGYGGTSKGNLSSGNYDKLSYFRNLFVHNGQRNPLLKVDEGEGCTSDTNFEIVNNVIYDAKFKTNFSDNDSQSGLRQLNYINNHYFEQIGGADQRRMLMVETTYPVAIYAKGNVSPTRLTISENLDWSEEWNITQGTDNFGGSTDLSAEDAYDLADLSYQRITPFNTPIVQDNVDLYDAVKVFDSIKSNVGASLPIRDSYDTARISDVENKTQNFNATSETIPTYETGTPYADNNSDGIDDAWSSSNMGGYSANDIAPSGYVWIEEFFSYLANDESTSNNQPILSRKKNKSKNIILIKTQ